MAEYSPEPYWSRVAREIEKRGENYIAGDDNPYYRYKRSKFLRRFLDSIDFDGKVVMELGCGPGGNLRHIKSHRAPKQLIGVDISQSMLDVAAEHLRGHDDVQLLKTDGTHLPLPDGSVDLAFTVTVLQHNTDARMFQALVADLCRVTRSTIVAMEDIGQAGAGAGGAAISRRVDVYEAAFAEHGFRLKEIRFLDTKVSRAWYRRVFGRYQRLRDKRHQEGDPIGSLTKLVIGLPLPLTRLLDNVYVERWDLAKMVFERAGSAARASATRMH